MLVLTDDATEAIEGILTRPGMPQGAGVRISSAMPTTDEGDASQLQVALASAPDDGDEVIEEGGARVFVEYTVAGLLDDKVLDAETVGEEFRFSIATAP